jgi:hypothetical protein
MTDNPRHEPGRHQPGCAVWCTAQYDQDRAEVDARRAQPAEWNCEAYGPDGPAAGRLCFYADPGLRSCLSPGECKASVAGARQVLFALMRDKAAAGDPKALELAAEFTSPDQPLRWPVTPGLPYVDRGGPGPGQGETIGHPDTG